ncbi:MULTISPECIES: cytochrome P450 [Streptomyces]|uniref:Cytochrome P450 n=1 Tax=Streptomyces bangladeshensis TaxID=295352 RepID=A0ABP5NYI9_9ACTN|nr:MULTISPECIES: cytochrome P450 [unclassified Streptomyces]MYU26938.1 cytochrome P450 [Streptomyces sp. SID7810]OYP13538.1 cytochrome P450 [Streptomyces sp. FBKL.4005]BCM65300.1 putative cytochrome P450 [Streptomyces sp. EAS-AB2608]CUW25770.1 Cytochrome P450 107B1 [Streptomyces reticuli]
MTTPDAVPLSGPRFQTEPARLYREMRRDHGAVVPVLLDGDVPAWLVLGYRELHQVTGDPVLFSRDSDLWNQWENIPADWPLLPMIGRKQPSILYTVGERHRERAAMISNALEAVDPFELRGHAERFADELLDALCAEGEADLIAQYAMLLPVRVLARLYGFPDEDGPGLVTALNDMIDGRERALAGQAHLASSMGRLLADRRKEPADDVVSRMLADESGFGDEEIMQDLMVMMAAGHQPTADWIGNSLRLMLTDDRFAASLFGGRHSVAEAMNEVLWEDTPTQNVAGRWAARDTHLGGRRIKAGDLLLLGLQGANSDPQVRTDAAALTGGNNAHFSFGHGEHRCPFPAQEIAEVIARTGIEVVLDRLPDIDLAVPAESLTRRPSPWLRGLTTLPVRFTPVPAR